MTIRSIATIVENDLCIGCGLCEAVTQGRVSMRLTAKGSLRPHPYDEFTREEEEQLVAACPGAVAQARSQPDLPCDPVWGAHKLMARAWAADPAIRFRAATGGVLTALGVHLLRANKAAFVLHVSADPQHPMRSRWVISETPQAVQEATASRYGPTAPLAGLLEALDRGEPFAVIAKPCDLGALHRFAQSDPRVDALCVARLALVCGGQSRLTKSRAVLDEFGVDEEDLTLFRYRGHGNPGPTVIETKSGKHFEKTYLDLWEDEAGWELETRCKLCPDALGEASDLAAADAWPGGAPTGEDEGFNAIIVRSDTGKELVEDAVRDGDLVLAETITPREFDLLQPHQVRKKEALAARLLGVEDAGVASIETHGLRIDELGQRLDAARFDSERAGARRRIVAASEAVGER